MANPNPRADKLIPGAKPTGRVTQRPSFSLSPADEKRLTAYLDAHAPNPKGRAGPVGRERSRLLGLIVAAGMDALGID